jgi:hypothetical protein
MQAFENDGLAIFVHAANLARTNANVLPSFVAHQPAVVAHRLGGCIFFL